VTVESGNIKGKTFKTNISKKFGGNDFVKTFLIIKKITVLHYWIVENPKTLNYR